MPLPIGGFMPIPLAMMIPFMATQSMVMGDAFGQAFQYGKRKISAMSNEEFNATSMEQLASQMFKAYQNIIPDLELSIKQSRALQSLIVTELLRLPVSIFQDVTGSSGDAESIRESGPTIPPTSPTGTSIVQDEEGNVTITNHDSSHADIVEIWRQIASLEREIIIAQQLLDARTGTSASAKIFRANKAQKIQKRKASIQQAINKRDALNRNHKITYGHDVGPSG